ncbi:DUF485 domain-containing protein [Rubrobacter indicoceani]|uniref:DUF485 domain-containing protein n=1 Tax=Rubrobacter indicoceani TaxID=2051957 RepID=UPI000E5ABF7C|nr:DUF485 domain-containing protein [Rubrobacter indicoceani]
MAREGEWVRVERTPAFKQLIASKKAFIIPALIFFLIFYFGLPVLTGFTTILNASAIGPVSWAYVYAFAQFIMTWTLLHLYVSQANKWDVLVDQARVQAAKAGEEG